MDKLNYLILFLLLIVALAACFMVYHSILFFKHRIQRRHNKVSSIQTQVPLTFEQCHEVLSTIIDDVYTNKYLVQYRLRDLADIKNNNYGFVIDSNIEFLFKTIELDNNVGELSEK